MKAFMNHAKKLQHVVVIFAPVGRSDTFQLNHYYKKSYRYNCAIKSIAIPSLLNFSNNFYSAESASPGLQTILNSLFTVELLTVNTLANEAGVG